MRILVNGYFYGGNCPPFLATMKKINPEVRLTNALDILDDHGINTDYLTEGDLLRLELTPFEKLIVRILKKLRTKRWKKILINRAKILVEKYKPDIIINHKASEKAEIMLRTGFRPQVTYIYGSEVHGNRVMRRELDFIFNESSYILTTTKHMASYVVEKRIKLKEKVKVFPMGYFELDQINNYKKENSKGDIRKKYGFNSNDIIFFENRSLRGTHAGLDMILEALKVVRQTSDSFKMIFLKGFLGTDQLVRRLRSFIVDYPSLSKNIIIIDEIVPNEKIIDYYYISDAFVSMLPDDQFGKCISDALFLDCSLILTDLEGYRLRLGKGPFYVKHSDTGMLADAFKMIISGVKFKVTAEAYDSLVQSANSHIRFKELHTFLQKLIIN